MNINFMAPINDVSYGIVGWNLLRELDKIANVTLWPTPCIHNAHITANNTEIVHKCVDRQRSFDYDAPSVRLWHQFDLAQHIGRGPRYGFPIFELDSFTKQEKHHLEWLDGIIVCSEWAAGVLYDELGIDNIHIDVVPLGVDPTIFYPSPGQVDEHHTRFLSVGKWEIRKGHDVLIDAFNAAFEPQDKVSLWMLSHNFFLEPERNGGVDGNIDWAKQYTQSKMGHKVDILSRTGTQAAVARIMNGVDCGVFPSRAEGFCLPLLEIMACGKPVIATDYSGHTEFVSPTNCLLIDVYEMEEAYDGKFFFGADKEHGNWAQLGEAQFDQLVYYMRKVHKDKQEQGILENHAGLLTAKSMSWENSAKKLLAAVDN